MKKRGAPKDAFFMQLALQLAEKGLGQTEPNPLVGAVVVRDGRVIAGGWHSRYGTPHAERAALERIDARGSTLYVTLEPCCHFGRTPPCTDIIVEKGIRRVVFAMIDPNPLVNGGGQRALRAKGVLTESGLLEEEAEKLNRHYLTFMRKKRPYIALHAGISLDGKMTDRDRDSCWINSALSRKISHGLRVEFAALLAGVNTVLEDNPRLTVREKEWREKKFLRVILDSKNRMGKDLRIFEAERTSPLTIFSSERAPDRSKKCDMHFFVPEKSGRLDLEAVLAQLAELRIASLLVEGGAAVLDSFLSAGLYDEIDLFFSNRLLGGAGALQPFQHGALLKESRLARGYRLIELENDFIWRGWF